MDKKLKILVVDDSSVMRKGIIELLNGGIPAEYVEAVDGNEAVNLYKKEKPDLVTMDINMPECDGMEALTSIMNIDKGAKIVMLTTEAEKEKIIEAVSIGAKSYIIKPINKERAIEKIRNVLGL